MPPANDNFANAITLSGETGYIVGTNVEATSQAGEPVASGGKTVWYKWTPPTKTFNNATWLQARQFSTRWNPDAGTLNPVRPLRTIVQVFWSRGGFGAQNLQNLEEVLYHRLNQTRKYAGWEPGSQVMFSEDIWQGSVTFRQTFYIRVDGVDGEEGEFLLSWRPYRHSQLDSCSAPPMSPAPGELCRGIVTMPAISEPQIVTFGLQPIGIYVVDYVRGARPYNQPGEFWLRWNTWEGRPPANPIAGTPIIVTTKNGENFTQFGHWQSNRLFVSDLTYLGAEEWGGCAVAVVCLEEATDITVQLASYSPETPTDLGIWANPSALDATYLNPVFALYKLTPLLTPSGASIVFRHSFWEGNFTIANTNRIPFSVSVELLVSGGITDPPAPFPPLSVQIVNVVVPANGQVTIGEGTISRYTLDIPGASPLATATLRFTGGPMQPTNGTFVAIACDYDFEDIDIELAPVISLQLIGYSYVTCQGNSAVRPVLEVSNAGMITTRALFGFTEPLTNGLTPVRDGGCFIDQPPEGFMFGNGVVGPNGTNPIGNYAVIIKRTDPTLPTSFRVTLTDGSANHGSFDFTVP